MPNPSPGVSGAQKKNSYYARKMANGTWSIMGPDNQEVKSGLKSPTAVEKELKQLNNPS